MMLWLQQSTMPVIINIIINKWEKICMVLSGLIMGMLSSVAHKAAPSSTSMREPVMLSEHQHRDVKTRTLHCRPKQARALLTDRSWGHLLLD